MTGSPHFAVVRYQDLPTAEVVVMNILKVLIICCVLTLAWRRRLTDAAGLSKTVGLAWIIFFVLSPGIAPQYMVWLAPFVFVLAPSLGAWVMASSSLYLFWFYNVTAGGIPWYLAVSTLATNKWTVPWALWPWATLLAALIILWRRAAVTNRSLPLFGLSQTEEPPNSIS